MHLDGDAPAQAISSNGLGMDEYESRWTVAPKPSEVAESPKETEVAEKKEAVQEEPSTPVE